ncbi:MAG: phosphoglucosamine mutase, partial [Actinomycetota bacterium]|nr:phosphoglucosamine mutase [Actinomycetota bacterium]
AGIDVYRVGIIPTPAVAYLVASTKADLGVMISASHNSAPDNGIKFFARGGGKLDDGLEEKIEARLGEPWDRPIGAGVGRIVFDEKARDLYINHLLSTISTPFQGIKVVVDCANGAASLVAPEVLIRAGAEVVAINAEPNGMNINENSGSTDMASLIEKVRRVKADIGIAYDGDADRALAVDSDGNIVDGDFILAILALDLGEKLKKKKIVGTVMTNLGLINSMRENGIEVLTTSVGDRYVLEKMVADDLNLGGEQSGHIIIRDYANTGDGVLTALALIQVMAKKSESLSKLASVISRYPQVLINVAGVDKSKLDENVLIQRSVAEVEEFLGEKGRVLLRASGTEALVRVMVEAESAESAEKFAQQLASLVNSELKL